MNEEMSDSASDGSYNDPYDGPCDCDIGVHFDTGFTYPIGSNYVGDFGGEEWGMWDLSEYTWRSTELPGILQQLEEWGHVPLFEQFPKTAAGTEELYESLVYLVHSKFRFGCVLAHQLTYRSELKGQIQTGQCGSRACWHRSNR